MARAKPMRGRMRDEAIMAKAERVAAEVMRIVRLIKIVDTLPEGRMRQGLRDEVDRKIADLRAFTG